MKKILLAVAVLLVLWIVAETNMGAIHRLVYGDIAPPDIPYTGGVIEGYNIVVDEVVRAHGTSRTLNHDCGVFCEWILKETPFDELYLTFYDDESREVPKNNHSLVAVLRSPCNESFLSRCITEHPVDRVPQKDNTVLFRKYSISTAYGLGLFIYSGYEFCVGSKVIARYGTVIWYSMTGLADFLKVGHTQLGKDVTEDTPNARDSIDELFDDMVKVEAPTEGTTLCPRNPIGL